MSINIEFQREKQKYIKALGENRHLEGLSHGWFAESYKYKYSYNFEWLGRPIIQYPQDMVALQELIWQVKPDIVIETGIAHGGSLIFHASILEMIGNDGRVLGIDIDIREHNREEIERHRMYKRITMIEGSSVDQSVVDKVYAFVGEGKKVMVILDSFHTHDHVLKELQLYSPLVTKDSYLIVFDTIVEDLPDDFFPDRPWGKGNNPKTAVWEFLKSNNRFEIDHNLENKLLITAAPDGYLKCIK
ncbi:MAG: cephalosporin hydroxylase [Clostridiaceae bacterium]|mgnify:CR=1 FL=1|nr:cephalosporin hydroxylase [Clostridiaceae bacterium]